SSWGCRLFAQMHELDYTMMQRSNRSKHAGQLLVVALLLLASLLGACSAVNTEGGDTLATATSPTLLRLAPADRLRVTVFGEERLSGEYQIDNSGSLSLPLAGTIQGAGLSKNELEQTITAQLKSQYLRNPKVTVDVVSYRPFYVLGEVQKPGEF